MDATYDSSLEETESRRCLKRVGPMATLRLLACATLLALLMASPRALALGFIGRLVPQAPLPQALHDFKKMWAPCKKPDAVFSGYSRGGQLYRWSVLTDHVFWSIELLLAYLGALHVIFPARKLQQSTHGVRLFGGLRLLFFLLGVVNFCVWISIDAAQYRAEMTRG